MKSGRVDVWLDCMKLLRWTPLALAGNDPTSAVSSLSIPLMVHDLQPNGTSLMLQQRN